MTVHGGQDDKPRAVADGYREPSRRGRGTGRSAWGTRRSARETRRDERGSASIEFAIIMSALIFGFFGLMIVAGRIMNQQNEVRSAAEAAARAASLEPTFGDAAAAAETVGLENLVDAGINCQTPTVAITSAVADFVPGGRVSVTIQCTAASLGTLSGLPDNDFFHEATEAIDEFRADP